jgi:hypothetical protein
MELAGMCSEVPQLVATDDVAGGVVGANSLGNPKYSVRLCRLGQRLCGRECGEEAGEQC